MASRYDTKATSGGVGTGFSEVQNTNTSGFTPSVSNSSGQQSSYNWQNSSSDAESFSGISNPEALASLLSFIKTGISGNPQYQAQLAKRSAITGEVGSLLNAYSTEAAFRDSELLQQQNLQKSMEAQMPSIMSAIQGAGTSASSMQGLLSQNLARDSALSAGALGAQQATAYGNISANLANTLEALSRIDNSGTDQYLKALELLKTSTSKSTSRSMAEGSSQGTQQSSSTGATPANQTTTTRTIAPITGSAPANNSSFSSFSGSDSDYQYIPYDLQNPGYINPYSSVANQQAAASAGDYYEWE